MIIKYIASLFILLTISSNSFAQRWQMNSKSSSLKFRVDYNGTPIKGEFDNFGVSLIFYEHQPDSFALTVSVDLTSVNTENHERDGMLKGHEWFATKLSPIAIYESKSAKSLLTHSNTFTSKGELTLKGIKKTVPIEFVWEEKDNEVLLQGEAQMSGDTLINRIDFGIGNGQWSDSKTIGHDVSIKFNIFLTKEENQNATD